jgi:hypothetical protein
MRKYRVRFRQAGREQEHVREGASEYEVKLDIVLNYPDATDVTVTPMPRSRQYDVKYDQGDQEIEKVVAGYTPHEIRQQVEDKHPNAKMVTILPHHQ